MKRRLIWGLGVALGLGVAVAVILPRLVSGDAMRDLVVRSIVDATGAEVDLGEAQVRVLPRLAVRLERGRIAGTGAELAARGGAATDIVSYAAEIALVEVRVALLPLLRREIEMSSLRVVAPRLVVNLPEDRLVLEDADLKLHHVHLGVPAGPATDGTPLGELIPADMTCRADLTLARLTTGGADYTQVTAAAELAGRVISVEPIRAGRGGGELNGTATFDYAADPQGTLTFAFTARGVAAAELLAPWAPDVGERLAADLEAAAEGGCRLQDPEVARATLALDGTITAGDGVLHAGDWLQEVVPYLGARRDLVDVRFRGLDHAFRVADGKYLVDQLEIDGLDTTWRGGGWVGLDDSIGLDLAVKLPPGFTPDLGAWSFLADTLRDEEGRVQLDLRLTGRSSQPKVSLDLGRLTAGSR